MVIWQEGASFVGKVLENSVSSFWATSQEAYDNTQEALKLYLTDNDAQVSEVEIISPKIYSLDISNA